MTASDLPCDTEPKDNIRRDVAFAMIEAGISHHRRLPGLRRQSASFVLRHAMSLCIEENGKEEAARICLSELERSG